MACGGMFSQKNLELFRKKIFNSTLLHLNFPCYYCSIDLKRQPEHSGHRPDTISRFTLIVEEPSESTIKLPKPQQQ